MIYQESVKSRSVGCSHTYCCCCRDCSYTYPEYSSNQRRSTRSRASGSESSYSCMPFESTLVRGPFELPYKSSLILFGRELLRCCCKLQHCLIFGLIKPVYIHVRRTPQPAGVLIVQPWHCMTLQSIPPDGSDGSGSNSSHFAEFTPGFRRDSSNVGWEASNHCTAGVFLRVCHLPSTS